MCITQLPKLQGRHAHESHFAQTTMLPFFWHHKCESVWVVLYRIFVWVTNQPANGSSTALDTACNRQCTKLTSIVACEALCHNVYE